MADPPTALTAADLQKAAKYAVRVRQDISSYSKLASNADNIPLFERDEVVLGDLLGSGGFNNVYEVHAIELSEKGPHSHLTGTEKQQAGRRSMTSVTAKSPFAVKFLNESCKQTPQDYCNGAADLLLETLYLSALQNYAHPNIIKLHGIAAAGPDGFATGAEGAYFLVLDRLYDTLDMRLSVWKELDRRKRIPGGNPEFELHLKALFCKQLQVGCDLASALAHLHKLRIIFRDLKPDNVGFDFQGTTKLFDFGLAKELDARQKNATGTFQMSGATGSRRYMAPEVARSEAYHLSADMYSYGILLWEVLALEKAYWDLSPEEHSAHVVQKGTIRPKLQRRWSPSIQNLLQTCWHVDPLQRPTAKSAHLQLTQELEALCKEHNIRIPASSNKGGNRRASM